MRIKRNSVASASVWLIKTLHVFMSSSKDINASQCFQFRKILVSAINVSNQLSIYLQYWSKRWDCTNRDILLFQNKARPSIAVATLQKAIEMNWKILSHSPDSPACDFQICGAIIEGFRGKQFQKPSCKNIHVLLVRYPSSFNEYRMKKVLCLKYVQK